METDRLTSTAELVIDPRLAELWQLVWGCAGQDEDIERTESEATLGCLLRLAYLQGYTDAAEEPEPGALWRELGVRPPRPTVTGAVRRPGARRRSRNSDI